MLAVGFEEDGIRLGCHAGEHFHGHSINDSWYIIQHVFINAVTGCICICPQIHNIGCLYQGISRHPMIDMYWFGFFILKVVDGEEDDANGSKKEDKEGKVDQVTE